MVSAQTPARSSPADSSPAYERAAPLWHGKSLWCGIVLRRQLLLQTQKRKAADLRTPHRLCPIRSCGAHGLSDDGMADLG